MDATAGVDPPLPGPDERIPIGDLGAVADSLPQPLNRISGAINESKSVQDRRRNSMEASSPKDEILNLHPKLKDR